MSAIGTLLFCPDCGNLLDRSPGSTNITCDLCHATCEDTSEKTTVAKSNPKNLGTSSLRLKRSAVQTFAADELTTEAKISQECPECGRGEMWFYTLQLRSADEGVSFGMGNAVGVEWHWLMDLTTGDGFLQMRLWTSFQHQQLKSVVVELRVECSGNVQREEEKGEIEIDVVDWALGTAFCFIIFIPSLGLGIQCIQLTSITSRQVRLVIPMVLLQVQADLPGLFDAKRSSSSTIFHCSSINPTMIYNDNSLNLSLIIGNYTPPDPQSYAVVS